MKLIKVEMPDNCADCSFNYDGLDCKLFEKRYREEVGETFEPYVERPEWCQFTQAYVHLSGEEDSKNMYSKGARISKQGLFEHLYEASLGFRGCQLSYQDGIEILEEIEKFINHTLLPAVYMTEDKENREKFSERLRGPSVPK